MALTLVKEDGTGKSDANSYANAADGDAYHDGHLYASAWTGATTANKEKALVLATRLIDAEYQFNGFRANDDQALQWPRENCPDPEGDRSAGPEPVLSGDAVPRAVVDATCELAREVLIADRTAAPMGEGLKSTRAADSEIWFDKADRRPVISHLAMAMLAKLGVPVRRGNSAARLVRT
jgi:hypothetical protein